MFVVAKVESKEPLRRIELKGVLLARRRIKHQQNRVQRLVVVQALDRSVKLLLEVTEVIQGRPLQEVVEDNNKLPSEVIDAWTLLGIQ
jgi:hypothetical protein